MDPSEWGTEPGPEPHPGSRRDGPLWLHPDDDLAPNRPGETLYGLLADRPETRGGRLARALLGRDRETAALRERLAGERSAGAALDRLAGAGWEILHSLPLPGAATLSHLAIGPAGVFGCHTVAHARGPLRVGDPDEEQVRTGTRRGEPHLRHCRRGAALAAHALTRGCGFPVTVFPVLICVTAGQVGFGTVPDDVRVLREHQVDGLTRYGALLAPDRIRAIHGVARDRRTWRGL
ncbi:nuclease-related domain-containing protein [Streptomyces carpaticus]|uniref:Nuclease-related domain-containing protein n=1 Tax=Streptomyces carpaticus TaxID=285558 RepID=A0ABV4ZIJ5_9ACTN